MPGRRNQRRASGWPERSQSRDSSASSVSGRASSPSPAQRCPHVGQAVHLPGLKKSLKVSFVRLGVCQACVREAKQRAPVAGGPATGAAPEPPRPISLCLRCGQQFCRPHLQLHFLVSTSDLHAIGLDLQDWHLACHPCQADIGVDSYKKLREAVEFVKKVERTKGRAQPGPTGPRALARLQPALAPRTVMPKPRGLANLGNTCFFNSVMQSLTQSHPLTHVLDQHSRKGAPCHIPSVALGPSAPASEPMLPAMALQLLEAGPITLSLAAFFKDTNSVGQTGVVNPGHLFGQVCRKSPQFRGFHQQDAHELLRHLTDGLRTEEVKRQKCAILKKFGLSEKTDPKSVDPTIKRQLQALSRHSNYTLVDQIFGGHLVSTIVCEQCQNSSQIYEPFLDLSLPVVEEKPPRPSGSKKKGAYQALADDDDAVATSCFGELKKTSSQVTKKLSQKQRERLKRDKRKHRKGPRGGLEEPAPMTHGLSPIPSDTADPPAPNQLEGPEGESGGPEPEEESAAPEPQPDSSLKTPEETCLSPPVGNDPRSADDPMVKPSQPWATHAPRGKPLENTHPDGNEEDEEDGFSDEDADWEWDYEADDGKAGDDTQKTEAQSGNESDYVEAPEDIPQGSLAPTCMVSLNPIPPERLERGSSREKSSEIIDREADEKGHERSDTDKDDEDNTSINGDIEDNIDDLQSSEKSSVKPLVNFRINDDEVWSHLRRLEPFHPDSNHLDPHMEQLFRKVRKLSVASFAVSDGMGDKNDLNHNDYQVMSGDDSLEEGKDRSRLRNEWVARSLTSISARYHSSAGECSIYSCLTQFTAPELLTGNNKWACDKCTQIQRVRKKLANGQSGHKSDSSLDADENESCDDEGANVISSTVYSNASKQLLIFCPPAVLTIQLKRFQQTMFNLRKVNRCVQFPRVLDLAPFCASTAVSTSTVDAGVKEILYDLYAVVEHRGRLQGGHYTAFVKVRPSNVTQVDYSKFYSSPIAKTDEIHSLLVEIERKCNQLAQEWQHRLDANECPINLQEKEGVTSSVQDEPHLAPNSNCSPNPPSKWYHISDSQVSEVSEEKVLKCQAYLLFYERFK